MDKKIRCSRCGGEHLQFVNVPISVKGKCNIIVNLIALSWIFAFIDAVLFINQICLFLSAESPNIVFFSITLTILFVLGVLFITNAIYLTVLRYYIPYQNDNIIKYVCEKCGNCEDLEIIALKDIECVYSSDGDSADS